MSQKFYGSICISDLVETLKKGHSGFTKSEKGKVYAKVDVWINDSEDEYGNILSIQLVPKKEKSESEKKVYIGNCKLSKPKEISEAGIKKVEKDVAAAIDDLPF